MPLLSFILCLNEVAWGTPRQEKMQGKEAGEWILVESEGVERLTKKREEDRSEVYQGGGKKKRRRTGILSKTPKSAKKKQPGCLIS